MDNRSSLVERFLRYVKIDTRSDEESGTHPSTENQHELARLLVSELKELGLSVDYDEDQELLEDVLVEIKQAIEMSNIYSNILANTMDAYSSIISNNMNNVMRALTIITIVLEIPNIIFAF